MRNSLRLAVVGAALSAISFASAANAAATATATATAEVLDTLSLTADSALDFGQIAANTGGTVTVGSDSNASKTGTLVSTGTRAPAGFTVTGSAGANVLVSLPDTSGGPVVLSLNDPSWDVVAQGPLPTMSLDGFESDLTDVALSATTGQGTFKVGGTLSVGSAQHPGVYNGTFDVSVEYQ
jgi:hypothetical protein